MEYGRYPARQIVCRLDVVSLDDGPYDTLTALPEWIPDEMITNLGENDRLFFVRDYDKVGYVAWLQKYLKAKIVGEVPAGYATLTAVVVQRDQLLKRELI